MMSADTQQRNYGGSDPSVVLPQPVTDKGIMESVTGFISDVVPQVSATGMVADSKDSITWARFEESEDPDNILLVLGYASGVQLWSVNASGEAREVLSWKRGTVRTVRVLLPPENDVHDTFHHKRPLVGLCDSSGPGHPFCSVSFVSLRVGDQVKIIKYKNAVSEIVCSRRVVVVSFPEKLAILDAGSLEEKRAIMTCYPASGPNPNPIALGARWLAYADKRMCANSLSAGGAESFSGQSVTATVLYAAKSLSKAVANSFSAQKPAGVTAELHPGVISIIDVNVARLNEHMPSEEMVAHFVAHSEPIVALSFDPSGMLLLTADKQGHDFHVFRLHPHACGSAGAAVHHLYVLHRGDTVAKVQDITWTSDSRWVAVNTLRGTTHVFALTSYGGPVGVRTHLSVHVVNRQSRFHRSAGLLADGRNSPETIVATTHVATPNPRLPPFPHPTILPVLGQIREGKPPSHENLRSATRQHSSEDSALLPLRLSAKFAPPRGWVTVGKPLNKNEKRLVDSLFIISCSGVLVEYQLKPKPASSVPRDKVCDDTALELDVEPKAQWILLRAPTATELPLPLSLSNPLMSPTISADIGLHDEDEHWLSQVEIVTHVGPHRRLWMGPQFSFLSFSCKDPEPVEVGRANRSNPMNIPLGSSAHPVVPVLIEGMPCNSLEQSPRLLAGSSDSDSSGGSDDLAECLADAMLENPSTQSPLQSSDFISL